MMNDKEIKDRIKELEANIAKKKSEKDYYKAMQLAYKLVLNGTYGAFANAHFVASNADIANSITSHGRDVIQYMMENIEHHFYTNWHLNMDLHKRLGMEYICKYNNKYQSFTNDFIPIGIGEFELKDLLKHKHITIDDLKENKFTHNDIEVLYEYHICDFSNVKPLDVNPTWINDDGVSKYNGDNQIIIYGDTDSCSSNTIIKTDCGSLTIEELYNKNISNGSGGNTLKGHESVLTNEKVLNYSKDKNIYYAPIKRIIRHKVSKEKWLLKTKTGKEIYVTNDHSMIVFRDGKQIEIKPRDIQKTDKILVLKKCNNDINE